MLSGPEALHRHSGAGSYVRLVDSCITQLQAQGPSWICNENLEEEEKPQDAAPALCSSAWGSAFHPRADARQSQKSLP